MVSLMEDDFDADFFEGNSRSIHVKTIFSISFNRANEVAIFYIFRCSREEKQRELRVLSGTICGHNIHHSHKVSLIFIQLITEYLLFNGQLCKNITHPMINRRVYGTVDSRLMYFLKPCAELKNKEKIWIWVQEQCHEIFYHFFGLEDSTWAPYEQTRTVL